MVTSLYHFGAKNILKDNDETFYFHCLRYYMPKLAQTTFEEVGLGLGVFGMQGFERRNKESKNTFKRFTTANRTSDALLVNNVSRLLKVFLYDINAY